jgi:hypothetical protein
MRTTGTGGTTVPGDEVHEEAGTSARPAHDLSRGRTGPRHAAPRRPLLTRLHVPAGKAIAMAAMPSAVLLGMGLTPQLASAKPLPKNPFKPGPCVSQPDKDDAEDEKAEKDKDKGDGGKGKDEPGGSAGDGSGASDPEPSPSEPPSSGGGSGGGGSEEPDDPEPSPSDPEPSPSDPEPSPSDPGEDEDEDDGGLIGGIGDAIGDILSPDEKKEEEAKEEEKKEEQDKAESKSASPKKSASTLAKPAENPVDDVKDGLEDTTDKVGKAAKDVTDGVKGDESATDPSDNAAPGKSSKAEKEIAKGGFPCVEEKKDAGKDEQTPATLPNDPWKLEASSLGLHGLDFEGVVNVRTQNGKTKQALKFTAKSVDIGDLHQIVEAPDGTAHHVRAAKGSTSTVKNGTVTMYTERLEGNLFGLIPIVFDPEHPPPLNIPEAYFTDVEVTQAGQFGGTLTVPGLNLSIE